MNLLLGDELKVERLVDENGNPYVLKVVGVFKNSDPEDLYWMRTPNSLNKECMMNFDLFNRLFVNMEAPEYGLNGQWYVVLDLSLIHIWQRGKEAPKTAQRAGLFQWGNRR